MLFMKKYSWIKVIDILGNKHEYENCDMRFFNGNIEITYKAPLGEVKEFYPKKNVISISYLEHEGAAVVEEV